MNSPYPASIPEFRILLKSEGARVLQVRYINSIVGYKGKWQDIPLVECEESCAKGTRVNESSTNKAIYLGRDNAILG